MKKRNTTPLYLAPLVIILMIVLLRNQQHARDDNRAIQTYRDNKAEHGEDKEIAYEEKNVPADDKTIRMSGVRNLEIPKGNTPENNGIFLERAGYTTLYNPETLCPHWVGWHLTDNHVDGNFPRHGRKFKEDPDVPEPKAHYYDIRESQSGYQRGHICPAGDNKWSDQAQTDAFLMTNICPQTGDLNQRDWKYLENACRDWAKRYGDIYIVSGPVFVHRPLRTIGENGVAVPDAFFKVVLRVGRKADETHAIGFIYDNVEGEHPMTYYVRTIDEVERITGLDFFHQLDDKTENKVEAESNLEDW